MRYVIVGCLGVDSLKLYNINTPKMGWPPKPGLRTGNNGKKILTFLKIFCNLPSLCSVI